MSLFALIIFILCGASDARYSYVDNQLRHSRRFDADGIERDHPELFVPFPRRRTSSSNSISSMTSASSSREDVHKREEGQLRYWTSDMCSHSPHLFDFVVTVSLRLRKASLLFLTFILISSEETALYYSHRGFSSASYRQCSPSPWALWVF